MAFTATAEATAITDNITIALSDAQNGQPLLDGNRNTFLTLNGSSIVLESKTPFTHLYLVWDSPPTSWQLTTEEGQASHVYGRNGFLHEAITLQQATEKVILQLKNTEYTLCDIFLFGDGTLPNWVQQWQPPLHEADLLILPTHADDEHLFFGGILPTYAGERQINVQVAYMTNHWGERYRPHELLDGLWVVGVTTYPLMGPFPDLYSSLESLEAAEKVYGHDTVLAWQVELLRRFRPKVVVGHDLAGEYGHGAHILNAVTLMEALSLSGDESVFLDSADQYGIWEVPKVYLHLYSENELIMDWNLPLTYFGGANAFEMAVAGFSKHSSQQNSFQVRQDGSWSDCRRFGLAHSLVGPDTSKNDLFENINPLPAPSGTLTPSVLASPSSLPAPVPVESPAQSENERSSNSVAMPAAFGIALLIAAAGLWLYIRKKH